MCRKIFFFVLFTGISLNLFSFQSDASSLKVKVVTIEDCSACSTEATEKLLKNIFSDISFERTDYRDPQAQRLIASLNGQSLPLFIFDKASLKAQDNFPKFSEFFIDSESFYLLDRQLSGIFFFLDRPPVAKKIDLFLSIYDSRAGEVAQSIGAMAEAQGMDLDVHLLFNPESRVEVEECLRLVSVRHIYPDKFPEYLLARLKDFNSSFWNILMDEMDIDAKKIAKFSLSQEAEAILEKDRALRKELGIFASPVILVDNQKIFSVSASSNSLEDLLAERP
jgi:hypothetical protein